MRLPCWNEPLSPTGFQANTFPVLADISINGISKFKDGIMSESSSIEVSEKGHVVEIRKEQYGYTLSHRLDSRIIYIGTYPNVMELKRITDRILEREHAEGHEVVLISDPGLS